MSTASVGCSAAGDDGAQPGGGSSASASPVDQLKVAYERLERSTVHIEYQITTMDGGEVGRVDADVDAETHAIRAHTSWMVPTVQISLSGSDLYVNWPGMSTKPWLHADSTRLRKDSPVRRLLSVFSVLRPLAGVSSASLVKPGAYEGVINLDKALAATDKDVDIDVLTQFARVADDKAAAVNFVAELDKQGRLSSLTYFLGSGGDGRKVSVSLYNYDVPFTIDVPGKDKMEEAQAGVYTKL